jgi:glucuronoarabinoxylan endo-1,4-beta-xylanase
MRRRRYYLVAFLLSLGLLGAFFRFFWSPAITVNWSATRQTIDGFGASATGYTGNLSVEQVDRFFSPDTGLGLSLLKIRAIADTLDADCNCVANNPRYKCVLGRASQIVSGDLHVAQLAAARGAHVFAGPWSPPAAMKSSGKYCAGGSIKGDPTNYAKYAAQLASFPQLLEAHGVSIDTLSVQNEPNIEDKDYDTCRWTAQQIHDFIPYLWEALRSAGFGRIKIALPEETDWKFDLMNAAAADSSVADKIGLIMGHAYNAEKPASLPSFQGRHVWQTEVSSFKGFDGGMSDGLIWARSIHNYMMIGANAWMYWNLDCGELYFNHDNNMCLTDQSGHFAKRAFVLGQYARFVRPGWQRVDLTNRGWLSVTAYKGPGGKFAIVVINKARHSVRNQEFILNGITSQHSQIVPWLTSASASLEAQVPVSLLANGSMFMYTIPASSVVTFQGQAD